MASLTDDFFKIVPYVNHQRAGIAIRPRSSAHLGIDVDFRTSELEKAFVHKKYGSIKSACQIHVIKQGRCPEKGARKIIGLPFFINPVLVHRDSG